MATNKWTLSVAYNAVKKGGVRGLQTTGDIIGDAAQKITPLDTGELETSLKVQTEKATLTCAIGFSKMVNGFDVAVEQHENMTYNHLPGKTAKYLELPFNQLGPALLAPTLADEIRKEIGA